MQVKGVMSKKVITVSPSTTVVDAAKLLREKRIGCLIVVEGKKPVGIVTERDFVYRIVAEGKNLSTPIGEVMTRDLRVVGRDHEIQDVVNIMKAHLIRRLPVVDKGELVGIITMKDIMSAEERDTKLFT